MINSDTATRIEFAIDQYTSMFRKNVPQSDWDKLAAQPADEQQYVLTTFRERNRTMATKIVTAIESKDIGQLLRTLTRHNPVSITIFTAMTAIRVKPTTAGCRDAIREFVGSAVLDQFNIESDAAHQQKQADEQNARVERERNEQLDEMYRYAIGGTGMAQPVKARDIIDDLISRGFNTIGYRKRGAFTSITVEHPEGRSVEFRKKYVKEYAEQRIAELQPVPAIPEATETELDHLFGIVR